MSADQIAQPPATAVDPKVIVLLERARHWFERYNDPADTDCEFANSDECSQQAADLEDDLSVMLTRLGALP